MKICYEHSYRVVTHHICEDIYFLFGAVTYRTNDDACFPFEA